MARGTESSQLARATDPAQPIGRVVRPGNGWLRSIREAHGLSLADQAKQLKVTPPAVRSFEQAEADDRITLASLRRAAAAMDYDLVYTLLPRAGSLTQPTQSKPRRATRTADQPKPTPSPARPAPASDSVVLDLTWRAQHGDDSAALL